MKKMYGLFAKTEGDDLFPPTETLVSTSENLTSLEEAKAKRERERDEWTTKFADQIPAYGSAGLITKEVIKELPQLDDESK